MISPFHFFLFANYAFYDKMNASFLKPSYNHCDFGISLSLILYTANTSYATHMNVVLMNPPFSLYILLHIFFLFLFIFI